MRTTNKRIQCHVTFCGTPICQLFHVVSKVGSCGFPSLTEAEEAIRDEDASAYRYGLKVVRGWCPERTQKKVTPLAGRERRTR
jgi:hypothetical protein